MKKIIMLLVVCMLIGCSESTTDTAVQKTEQKTIVETVKTVDAKGMFTDLYGILLQQFF